MKRCPQCEFIYPDRDKVCDFDQTTLIEASESEIAELTNTPERPRLADLAATHSRNFAERKSRKALPIAAASGLVLGIAIVSGYLTLHHLLDPQLVAQIEPVKVGPLSVELTKTRVTPAASLPPSAAPSSPVVSKQDPRSEQVTTKPSRPSVSPISTSGAENTSKSQVIVLTTGNRVEADQVWRTKDGVWYRKNGIVTLVKKNLVKAIVER